MANLDLGKIPEPPFGFSKRKRSNQAHDLMNAQKWAKKHGFLQNRITIPFPNVLPVLAILNRLFDVPPRAGAIRGVVSWSDYSADSNTTMPTHDVFEGLKLDATTNMMSALVTHSLAVGQTRDAAAYNFSIQTMFLGFPAFGRVDNEGNVVGRLIYDTSLMGGKYKMGIKGGGQVAWDDGNNAGNGEFEISRPLFWTSQIKYQFPGVWMFNHVRHLFGPWQAGMEVTHIGFQGVTMSALGVAYQAPRLRAVGLLSEMNGASLSFTQPFSSLLTTATDFTLKPTQQGIESNAGVGLKYEKNSRTIKGRLDTEGKLLTYLQEELADDIQVQFATEFDLKKLTLRLGLGATVSQDAAPSEWQTRQAALERSQRRND